MLRHQWVAHDNERLPIGCFWQFAVLHEIRIGTPHIERSEVQFKADAAAVYSLNATAGPGPSVSHRIATAIALAVAPSAVQCA